jgi:hypothetical protein
MAFAFVAITRLQVTGRTRDNVQYVCQRPLLLQRLVSLASEPRDLCFLAGSG